MEIKTFSTRELGLAAALVALGHDSSNLMIQYEGKRNQAVGYFEFPQNPDLDEIVSNYWKRALSIEPQSYHAALRALKSRVTDQVNR